MKVSSKHFLILLLLICSISLFSGISGRPNHALSILTNNVESAEDTSSIYSVKKTQITNYEDLTQKKPIDLRDPSNVQTEVEYDLKNNVYLFKTKIDNDEWITPFNLDPEQYADYSLKKSMSEYFKAKNAEAFEKRGKKEDFSLRDIRVNTGALERMFGPGGVQVKTQGYVEVSMGMKHTKVDNPTISARNRSRLMFDFDEKIQMKATATVGNKIDFDLNYDTESTFDFDTKRIKLAYEGEEDEILKHLEAGNVSMTTTNSLINGGASLFGIKADLQFGKLRINTVISQQESESQTVNSKGGIQTMSFEFKADEYDENQHFFLSQYFRDEYDRSMRNATNDYVQSGVLIGNIEVWITNKQGNFSNSKNIVGFADLGESRVIGNSRWTPTSSIPNPYNDANSLYSTIRSNYNEARDINKTYTVLTEQAGLEAGLDYEKLESARLLSESEYTVNKKLGYISLNIALGSDQVLAVAYNYTKGGQVYQVGEFGSNLQPEETIGEKALFVKLLKPFAMSPRSYTWDLMMKNVYRIGATQVQKDKFRLNIYYQNDTVGTYTNYIQAGKIRDERLLRVMGLDRLNAQGREVPNGDGIFDFLEGLTILPENGRIIFPVVEPFGEHLRIQIGDDELAKNYVYQELYDSTLTVAQQIADKNKFKISGTYRASASSSQLNLNAMNVARGSVIVTANGTTLTENVDYTVDYTVGTVNIINEGLIESGAPISVTLENQSLYSMKKKTLLGLNLSYEFSKNFSLGGTIMHMYEKPLVMKSGLGEESIKNTLWGLNASYQTSSRWLTSLIDKLPFVEATAPSHISFNGEFAQLIAGHYESKYGGGYSYLDDFEAAKSRISVLQPYGWKLSSTPSSKFPEAMLNNDLKYGNNRAHLAWFSIDNIFTRRNSSLRPRYINEDSISNHWVRPIYQNEIYPDRDIAFNQSATISTLNLSYYPEQRGVYNLDADGINADGKLMNPENRWGGIMRKLDNTNFETSNIEYIEFWLMDPFVYNHEADKRNDGGEIYFNLGEISEDVLKDGRKFYENGLPTTLNPNDTVHSVWGVVPSRQSTVYAFDNALSVEDRIKQDAGFNGLITDDEFQFPTYRNFIESVRAKLNPEALRRLQNDPHSFLNDPSGDNYEYYRSSYYDEIEASILDRYKYYNGTEGNTMASELVNENYSSAATPLPDVEDLNQDNTMNETENYFQYRVELNPDKMNVGENYISDLRVVPITLENGQQDTVRWYQFQIPIRDGEVPVGRSRPDLKAIRFMRMFLTGFKQETFLRFATLDLVRGDWRVYTQQLQDGVNQGTGILNVSAVNIEENSSKTPVNYVIPPGISRVVDPNQAQLLQQNEQALSLQLINLAPRDARAVYKNTNYDLRLYKRLQMFTHAEALIDDPEGLGYGEMTAFIRLGSDFRNNYYEYEIPLRVTPPGQYSSQSTADQEAVWPKENMFDFPLELLTNLKLQRNKEKRRGTPNVDYTTLYTEYDPDPTKGSNKISIIGNPSLSEVSVIMIGVRNNADRQKSAEVWVNELRLTDYDEEGGWAAQGNINLALSDIATVNLMGRKETAGFGAIDQSLLQRRNDDYSTYTISTNVDLGRFVPKQAKLSVPLYYSYSNQTTTPKYDPLDQDIRLKDALDVVETKQEKDSIKNLALDKTITKNLSLTNVRVNVQSQNPMPYDPANFTFGYAFSKTETSNPTTAYDLTQNYKASMGYSYSPALATWEPFKSLNSKSPWAKYPQSLGINLLPSNISFNINLTRFYTETLTRDLDSYTLGGNNDANRFFSYSDNFYSDRDFSITWDLLRNLKLSLQTGTRAEIEEPFLAIDRPLNPDDYDILKDGITRGLRQLGNPLEYRQTAQATYNLPMQHIPILDWINSSANYNSTYNWDRGNTVFQTLENSDERIEVQTGNTVTNTMTLNLTNRFDLTKLYNKSSFLRKTNQKFESTNSRRPEGRPTRERPPVAKKPFQQDVTLNTDSGTIVKHNLNTKKIHVSARKDGKSFKLKYKRIDENTIRINTKDSVQIKLNVVSKESGEESKFYKVAQYVARGLMSIRSAGLNYSMRDETAIAGFRPSVGDVFGQKSSGSGMAPGLGFAFGLDGGESFIQKSIDRNWLLASDQNITPAVHNSIRKFEMEVHLEPIRALKIRLSGLHEKNDRTSFDFSSYNGQGNLSMSNARKTLGGSFTMSTIALSTSFSSGNANNNYKSKGFDKFIEYRNIMAQRQNARYNGLEYPQSGFLTDKVTKGISYDSNKNPINANSADVLIPAFLAAYTGKDASKASFSPFPTLLSLLPNWTVSYDGLTTLPWFKDKFKSFRLMHGYTAQYRVGSYSSHLSWVQADNQGLGFIQGLDASSADAPLGIPSSQYDISSVSIVEQFNPLFGADGTLNNNLTFNARYNYSRTLNLNTIAYQVVETLQKDLVIGAGYKINEFNRVIGLPEKRNSGFNNDLTIKGDLSRRTSQSLIRKIEDEFTEATSGTTVFTLKMSAEYTLSKALLLRAFFDRVINTPLISSSSYPTANTNFGFSLRFTLNQ